MKSTARFYFFKKTQMFELAKRQIAKEESELAEILRERKRFIAWAKVFLVEVRRASTRYGEHVLIQSDSDDVAFFAEEKEVADSLAFMCDFSEREREPAETDFKVLENLTCALCNKKYDDQEKTGFAEWARCNFQESDLMDIFKALDVKGTP